jgi:hypothetical protein
MRVRVMVFNVTFNNISVVAVICNEQKCLICIFILLYIYIEKIELFERIYFVSVLDKVFAKNFLSVLDLHLSV